MVQVIFFQCFLPAIDLLQFVSVSSENKVEKGTQFVVSGVRELLKARRILCGSYVYGYYLQDNGYNKSIFEFMQVCSILVEGIFLLLVKHYIIIIHMLCLN